MTDIPSTAQAIFAGFMVLVGLVLVLRLGWSLFEDAWRTRGGHCKNEVFYGADYYNLPHNRK